MKKVVKTAIKVRQGELPAKIWFESRRNVRASIGKTGAILRMPFMIGKREYRKQYDWFVGWVEESLCNNPALEKHFFRQDYYTGQRLQVGPRAYTLSISYEQRKTATGKRNAENIELSLPEGLEAGVEAKTIRTLLSRIVAAHWMPEVRRKVLDFNERYFQKSIHDIKLKYTHSRWGSCSSKGTINLSTRLLFAPEAVMDYVIVHELAHLVEHNHSPKFWQEVARVMPEYEQHEQWLKENQHLCDF